MKIALVHDWLEAYAGSERVLEQLIKLYPQADVFALVDFVPEKDRGFLQGKKVRTSFIQWMPLARKFFRYYLPIFPLAVWAMNLRGYDVVLSDSHCMAKNVRVAPEQVHVCYCHSPIRYAWDMQEEYLAETGLGGGVKGFLIRTVMGFLRWVDVQGAKSVDVFIGNSNFIAERIKRCYGREALVVNPPVAVQDFPVVTQKGDFYVTASRMVPYKKMDMVVQAFAKMPKRKLVVVGDGPEMAKVKRAAIGADNVEVMGYQPFKVLKEKMQQARAFVFAAREDFGIAPVEALACGTPVIGFGEGGLLDSVVDGECGILFKKQSVSEIIKAVEKFERHSKELTAKKCRARAEIFSEKNFRDAMAEIVKDSVK